jgi:hypothetical protein
LLIDGVNSPDPRLIMAVSTAGNVSMEFSATTIGHPHSGSSIKCATERSSLRT